MGLVVKVIRVVKVVMVIGLLAERSFYKTHKTLRVTLAIGAGLTIDTMTIEDIVRLAD